MAHPILPLLPLIASTAQTTIGIDAVVSIPALADLSPADASRFFNRYFYRLLGPIITLGTASSMIGSYIYFRRGGNAYFGWGALLAGLHFAYVPLVMYPCQTILENKTNKDDPRSVEKAVKKWVFVHKFRLVGDIMSAVCFTLALSAKD
jgi:hypothetical protein